MAVINISCDAETIAAIKDAVEDLAVKGCMNEDNEKYNPSAVIHVADSCAVQIYGCTDPNALNYDATATNMCSGISEDQCCTSSVSGCTDPNYTEYNENANADDGSCATAITHGCMDNTACNYNEFATTDCNKQSPSTGAGNTNCCVAASTTTTECVQDFDNDGYQDAGTESQTLAVGNCGCGTIGYGWKDKNETNGEVVYGCLDPMCPEFDANANRDDGNCCLGFTAEDSTYFETEEYSLLGGYELDFSECEPDMGGNQGPPPQDHKEQGYIFLGYGGEFYEEFLSVHILNGFRAHPFPVPGIDNPNDCKDEAEALGSHFFCANEIGGDQEQYRPCQEEIFEDDCYSRDECFWEGPECRWKPNPVIEVCFQPASQNKTTCESHPGCQWDDGGQEEYGEIMWEPYCEFNCWGLSEAACNNSALNSECQWEPPDSNDGACLAPESVNSYEACNALDPGFETNGSCSDESSTTKTACEANDGWWDGASDCYGFDDLETGAFVCICSVDSGTDAATTCASKCTGCEWKTFSEAECERKFTESACDGHTSPSACNSAPDSENCDWDYEGGYCFKDAGADCWELGTKAECDTNTDCDWFSPPGMNPNHEYADYADEGVCHFFDWCHEAYRDDESGCKDDDLCKWEKIPGQKETCIENPIAQYCDCHIEWSKTSCEAEDNTFWNDMHKECMFQMDEHTCYFEDDLQIGPEDGNINCDEFLPEGVEHYTEWIETENVCEDIFVDSGFGTWELKDNQLCIESEGLDDEVTCEEMEFSECQCNLHRCHWQPESNNPQHFESGTCNEGPMDPEGNVGGRVKLFENYKYQTVSSRYQFADLVQFIHSLNGGPGCMDYSVDETTGIITVSPEDMDCNVKMIPVEDDDS